MSQTKTYEGSSIEELLPQIREDLGSDAIVMRQREGLKGGVGGFFQKRCVEVEARAGHATRLTGPAFDVTDGAPATPPGVAPAPQPQPAPAAVTPVDAIAPEPAAETVPAAPPAGFVNRLAEAAEQHAEAEQAVGRALTLDDILGAVAAPAPAPVAEAQPAPAVAAPAAASPAITTSPQVDALPVAAPVAVAPAPEPVERAPAPAPAAVAPAPVPAPAPVAVAPAPAAAAAVAATARAPRAERVVSVLTERGINADFATALVDDIVALRAPLRPGARLTSLVARELAQRIPVAALARPTVTAWVGMGGAGKTTAIAALARAHAQGGGLPVACLCLHSPDGGAALRVALQASGVEVYVARDEAEGAALVSQLTGSGRTVLVDTPAISPRNEAEIKALARRLRRTGVTEVQVCIPATLGLPVAHDVVSAVATLKPTALTITHSDETERLGAAVQLAIDTTLPIAYVGAASPEGGHVLHAADPAELAKALIG